MYGSPGWIADSAPLEVPSLERGGNFVLWCYQTPRGLAASPEHRPPAFQEAASSVCYSILVPPQQCGYPVPFASQSLALTGSRFNYLRVKRAKKNKIERVCVFHY